MLRLSLLLGLFLFGSVHAQDEPRLSLDHAAFDFGKVIGNTPIEHGYIVRNTGLAPLRIEKVVLTPPLRLAATRAQIPAGAEGTVRVQFDPGAFKGPFNGQVLLSTNDTAQAEVTLTFSGEVVPPIEVSPLPMFFLAGHRGESTSASLEIVNHESGPLRLESPRHLGSHFTTRVETIEKNQRYRLTITLLPDGPTGKLVDDILIRTSSKSVPLLRIAANTLLRERVYTFPDAVDLGALRLEQIKSSPDLLRASSQSLMVYQNKGRDFRVSASSDVEGLDIRDEPGPRGDRHRLVISLDPNSAAKPRAIEGHILIRTNDPEFPQLRVPVSGALLGG